jgi:hypothetical protein
MRVCHGDTQRDRSVLMSLHVATKPSPLHTPSRTLYQMHSIRSNMLSPSTASNTHIRCEPIFNNTFGDKP